MSGLEVYLDGELRVGWLDSLSAQHVQKNYRNEIMAGATALRIAQRHCEIDRFELARDKFAAHAKGIPSYAEQTRDPTRDVVRFSWIVVTVSLDQYEELFECPDFAPVDTESDEKASGTVSDIESGTLSGVKATHVWVDEAHDLDVLASKMSAKMTKDLLYGTSTSTKNDSSLTATSLKKMLDDTKALLPPTSTRFFQSPRRSGKSLVMEQVMRDVGGVGYTWIRPEPIVKVSDT